MESGIFLYSEARLERAECSAHYPNIRQQPEGVKKEQVKGCGSVNRPTPGSQRPAEPVVTGFSQGVKIQKIRGRFDRLGVKLWVMDARFPRCRAILHGVTIGVVANSCYQQGKQSAWLSSLAQSAGLSPAPPRKILFFSSALRRVPHLKICAA